MKKIFGLVFTMFALYILIQIGYNLLSKGYETNYEVNGYNVFEKYVSRTSGEKDSYYIEVPYKDVIFKYNTYKDYKKHKEIVTNVNIIESGKYKCIYLTLKLNRSSNVLCLKNGITYNYQDIKGESVALDNAVKELKYDITKYMDTAEEMKRHDGIFVSQANLVKGQFMGLTSYKGVFLINNYSDVKYLYEVDIFNKERPNQNIATFVGKKYIVADYDQYESRTFDKFYIVETTYGDKSEITYHSKISFDSYIMGNIGNKVYLLDCDNKKQYEIDIKTKSIIEVGNEKIGIKYYENGKWEKLNYITAINNKPKFIYNSEDKAGYVKVDLQGGKSTGYKYYYKKNDNKYDVYRSMQKNDDLMYIFSTTNLDNIVYYNDYVYFQEGDYIKCYHDDFGVKKIYHGTKDYYVGNYNFGVSNE